MTDDEFLFSAVAELNNIAVQLIQHGLYLEAISTLKDAIQLTKNHFCNIDNSSGGSDGRRDFSIIPRQRANIDYVIHGARKCKESIHPRELTENEIDRRRNPTNILVVSDKGSATVVHRALQQNPDTLCCISADTDFSYMLDDGLQLQSTIVLYNYGIAFRCIVELHHESINESNTAINIVQACNDAAKASFQIFQLSHTLISRSIHVFDFVDEGLNLLIPCCLLIFMLVLRNLHHLSSVTPSLRNREAYYNHEFKRLLIKLRDVEILQFIETNMTSSNTAPAA